MKTKKIQKVQFCQNVPRPLNQDDLFDVINSTMSMHKSEGLGAQEELLLQNHRHLKT